MQLLSSLYLAICLLISSLNLHYRDETISPSLLKKEIMASLHENDKYVLDSACNAKTKVCVVIVQETILFLSENQIAHMFVEATKQVHDVFGNGHEFRIVVYESLSNTTRMISQSKYLTDLNETRFEMHLHDTDSLHTTIFLTWV